MALVEDISGTPPIEETSATTSDDSTEWKITLTNGKRYVVTVPGDGRISYGGRRPGDDGAEVRFYRTQTTKTFDAVIPGVRMVVSSRVSIKEDITEEEKAEEERRERQRLKIEEKHAKDAIERVAESIVRREYADGEVEF